MLKLPKTLFLTDFLSLFDSIFSCLFRLVLLSSQREASVPSGSSSLFLSDSTPSQSETEKIDEEVRIEDVLKIDNKK